MPPKVNSVADYLAALPEDRKAALLAVRKVLKEHLDPGYEEGIQYGMIGYYVPHRLYPAGYHADPKQPLPFAALASQKGYMSLYLMGLYCSPTVRADGLTEDTVRFREAWARTGKKLDMGKACVRFKSVEALALDVIGEAVKRIPAKLFIERYEASLESGKLSRKASATKGAAKKAPAKKAPAKKAPAKKAAAARGKR